MELSNETKTKRLLITLAACIAITVVVGSVGCYWIYLDIFTRVTYHVEYPHMRLHGSSSDTYDTLGSGGEPDANQVADIFVRFPDGNVYRLSDVPEAVVAQHCHSVNPPSNVDPNTLIVPPGEDGTCFYSRWADSSFIFRNGRMISAYLQPDSIEIARNESGPFFDLPISAPDLESAFGHPKRTWSTRSNVQWR
jgi:hypothetical protein